MSRRGSAAAAALAIGALCACGSAAPNVRPGASITLAQFDSLPLGESWTNIARQFGTPERRRNIVEFGFTHDEPQNQRCIYYRRRHPDAGDPWNSRDTFQLCFEGSRLQHKWAYIAARA
jgi:hypothetical protein